MKNVSEKWLSELNERQREAVTHENGPLLVVAGAGSGKTRTLAYKVAYLISRGVDPNRILLLTFTRRAAKEMIRRAAEAISMSASSVNQVWGGTFHAVANRLLRIYAQAAGVSPDFTIIDQSDAADSIDIIRHKKSFSKLDKRFPRKGTCLAVYSRCMNSNNELAEILKTHFPWCEQWKDKLKKLFKEYVIYKQKNNILDYDDLLLYLYHLLGNKSIANTIEQRFEYILVDEYQDTNKLQADIIYRLRKQNTNVMAVGDDAQSIYSFRSATIQNMLDFPNKFPQTVRIKLEQNYRSTKSILITSNSIIEQSKECFPKTLYTHRETGQHPQLITCRDESHENEVVTQKILEHYEQGIPLHNQAVLFRASSHSNSLEIALTAKNIPFHKYGGLRFLEASHVKDLIGILRILENARDEMAWFRILKLFDGIGPKSASHIFEHVKQHSFNVLSVQDAKIPKAALNDMSRFSKMLKDLVDMKSDNPSLQIERINRFYLPVLKRNYENAEPRIKDMEYMGKLAVEYKHRTQFLSELVLDPPNVTGDLAKTSYQDNDYLTLSTIHSAKGCEWDAVYIIHAADGWLPSDLSTGTEKDIEEELRLTYVAMTRPKNFLYILWPLRFYNNPRGMSDFHRYNQCCRFFTPDVLKTVEQKVISPDDQDIDIQDNSSISENINAKIRDLWD